MYSLWRYTTVAAWLKEMFTDGDPPQWLTRLCIRTQFLGSALLFSPFRGFRKTLELTFHTPVHLINFRAFFLYLSLAIYLHHSSSPYFLRLIWNFRCFFQALYSCCHLPRFQAPAPSWSKAQMRSLPPQWTESSSVYGELSLWYVFWRVWQMVGTSPSLARKLFNSAKLPILGFCAF